MENTEHVVLRSEAPRDADGLAVTSAARRRTKKWAPRATTGCLTCRLKHVKCDEVRPLCGRCFKLRLECHFDRNPAVVRVALELPNSRDTRVVYMPIAAGGLTPLQNDWIKACRQFGIILSTSSEDPLTPSQDTEPGPAVEDVHIVGWEPDITMASRIRFVLAHCFTQHTRHCLLPHQDSLLGDMETLKRKFDHYTGQVLAELSADIGDPQRYREKQVLYRLSILIAGDISLSTPTLPHHLRGFIAVVEARGGICATLESNELHRNALFLVMMSMIITNTTSPSSGQMAEEAYFTNEDVYAYCAGESMDTFPCPTFLLLCIRDVSRLRREMACGGGGGGGGGKSPARGAAQAIFRNIASFAPEAWRERYALPEPQRLRSLLAATYKSATMLYAMMTLAGLAGIPFDTRRRVASAGALVDLVLAMTRALGDHLGMVWPLMVAGASLGGDGVPSSRRAVVDSLLLTIGRGANPSAGVYLGLECLRQFWKSGKTEWDECFTTWQATVP